MEKYPINKAETKPIKCHELKECARSNFDIK